MQHRFVILEENKRHKVDLHKHVCLPPGSREMEPKYTISLLSWGSRNQRSPFWFGGDGKPSRRSCQWEINRRAQEICLPPIFLTTELNMSVVNARKLNKIESQESLENYRNWQRACMFLRSNTDWVTERKSTMGLMCLSPNQWLKHTGAADISRKAKNWIELLVSIYHYGERDSAS